MAISLVANVDTIVAMRRKKVSYAKIASAIGTAAGSVSLFCLTNGITAGTARPTPAHISDRQRGGKVVRAFTPSEDSILLAMESEGATYTQMAKATCRGFGSVKYRMANLARRCARQEKRAF